MFAPLGANSPPGKAGRYDCSSEGLRALRTSPEKGGRKKGWRGAALQSLPVGVFRLGALLRQAGAGFLWRAAALQTSRWGAKGAERVFTFVCAGYRGRAVGDWPRERKDGERAAAVTALAAEGAALLPR